MRNFIALSQQITRNLSPHDQDILFNFMTVAYEFVRRHGIQAIYEITIPERPIDPATVPVVETERVRRADLDFAKIVSKIYDAKPPEPSSLAKVFSGVEEGAFGTTPGSKPIHTHNEVRGIDELTSEQLEKAADLALARVREQHGFVPQPDNRSFEDEPSPLDVPSSSPLTSGEEAIVGQIREIHGEAAAATATAQIIDVKREFGVLDVATGTETEDDEEPSPLDEVKESEDEVKEPTEEPQKEDEEPSPLDEAKEPTEEAQKEEPSPLDEAKEPTEEPKKEEPNSSTHPAPKPQAKPAAKKAAKKN